MNLKYHEWNFAIEYFEPEMPCQNRIILFYISFMNRYYNMQSCKNRVKKKKNQPNHPYKNSYLFFIWNMCTHRESVKIVVNEELIKIVCVFIQNKNGAYFILSQN